MKRSLGILVVLVMLVSMVAGCTTASMTPTVTTSAPTAAPTEATMSAPAATTTLPLAASPVTLSLAIPENPIAGTSYADNVPVFQELEKRTNVKISWQVIASADYNKTMQTRIAAATDLPDIYLLPEGVTVTQLNKGGLVTPLNDLIAKYGPNISKLLV